MNISHDYKEDKDTLKKERKKQRDSRKKFKTLPKKMIYMKNGDKLTHEAWFPNRNIANLPRPYRAILCGGVNSGKTTTAKNLILRAYPRFDRIMLVHCSPSSTEWDDLGLSEEDKFTDIPDISEFPEEGSKEKCLIILEDVEYVGNESKHKNLYMLFRYISTHCNTSVILNYQSFIKVPKIARRLASFFTIWRMPDLTQMQIIERKVGLKKGELLDMFENCCDDPRDSISFDLSLNTPAPIRKNIFQVITKQEDFINADF